MAEEATDQNAVFQAARNSIVMDLEGDLMGVTFDEMLARLEKAARAYSVVDGARTTKPVRYFTRHHLKLSGDANLNKVRGWLKKTVAMSNEDVILVLKTLQNLSTVVPPLVTKTKASSERRPRAKSAGSRKRKASGGRSTPGEKVNLDHLRRKIIDSFIGTCNGTAALMVESGVHSKEVSGSDRMRIKSALEIICACLGMGAKFAKIKSVVNAEPITGADVAATLGRK